MKARRTNGLAVLSRLKRHELERVALEMAETNRQLAQIEVERQALLGQLNERGDPGGVEATRVLSDFIRNVSAAVHHKETEARHLRDSSIGTHNQLIATFAEAKRIDLIRNRRAAAQRRTAEEAETAAQNEMFLAAWQHEHGK